MDKRQLGRSSLWVAPLAFGGNVFGWTADEVTSFALLDAFVAQGGNFIDTADMYSTWVPGHKGGESETIIGNWLQRRGRRDDVIIATKVGMVMGPGRSGLRREYILRSVEDSLRRLRTDYIDLYQAHKDDSDTPLDETLEAFSRLVDAGKVRAIGASNYGSARLAAALQAGRAGGRAVYRSLQPHYNLYDRKDYEQDLEPLCRSEGLGVIPYYSLASGFLTGKYRSEADLSKSPRGGGIKKYLDARGQRILAALDSEAAQLNTAQASVALAWLMARPGITAPIASATSVAQMEPLMASLHLKLDAAAIARLDAASAW